MQGQGAERNSLIVKIDHKTTSNYASPVKKRGRELTFTEFDGKPDVLINVNTSLKTLEKREGTSEINSTLIVNKKSPLLKLGK